jgi:hypothetical protein
MRNHIMTMFAGLVVDAERLDEATNQEDYAARLVDVLERLEEERRWLASQPSSSILDDDARMALNRYRVTVTRAALVLEQFLLTLDPEAAALIVPALNGILEVEELAELIPED